MPRRVIISGGGTGGHIFPAVSIGSEIRRRDPDAEILFVGAKGGMELEVVPRYDFPIEAVWISGIHRQLTFRNFRRNLLFPLKLMVSLVQSNRIISQFNPQVVVGVGGYASGPLGRVAAARGIPLVICEQNAFPGLTNRWLASKASRILLGNEAAGKYFPGDKIKLTGNPIRSFPTMDKQEAAQAMGIELGKPTVLSLGGSLGALTLNEAWMQNIRSLIDSGVQLIWQCGKRYYDELKDQVPKHPNVKLVPFIRNMAAAYTVADLVVSRAGGSTISELIALSKPSIMVPSPNVAEDHQTKNALSLSDRNAAILVKDVVARETLVKEMLTIMQNPQRLMSLQQGIDAIQKHDAAKEIVDELYTFM